MSEVKTCAGCRHGAEAITLAGARHVQDIWHCHRNKGKIHLVTGSDQYDVLRCEDQRYHTSLVDGCGPSGKYWQAKDAI